VQEAVKGGGILRLKDGRLQQVDEAEDVTVEQHVITVTQFTEAELSSALQQCTQQRQLPATKGKDKASHAP